MARSATAIGTKGDTKAGVEHESQMLSDVALRRNGKPEEVASLISFLLSDESTYITGNCISIDGGWFC